MSETENYNFTRAKLRAERSGRLKASATTFACVLIPAALGSLVHVGWAIGLAVVGLAVDVIYFRRAV